MKKIIALLVVGMFLLIGLSGLTALATDTKTQIIKNENQIVTLSENDLPTTRFWPYATVKCEFEFPAFDYIGIIFIYDLHLSGHLTQPLIINGITRANPGQHVTLDIALTNHLNLYQNVALVRLRGLGCWGVTATY